MPVQKKAQRRVQSSGQSISDHAIQSASSERGSSTTIKGTAQRADSHPTASSASMSVIIEAIWVDQS